MLRLMIVAAIVMTMFSDDYGYYYYNTFPAFGNVSDVL